MTFANVIFLLAAFVVLDFGVRIVWRRLRIRRELAEREAVLRDPVRVEFADEVRTLKRAALPKAKARILAVDDEPVVLDAFRRALVLEGYDVDTVESGAEALTLVRHGEYDFVFTDIRMPGMDGVEVVRAVKDLRPDVDVVVITGHGTIETAVATLRYGASEYIQKPFTADELAQFINRLQVKRQARQESLSRLGA
jgi:CheY-like chemotaxis protein